MFSHLFKAAKLELDFDGILCLDALGQFRVCNNPNENKTTVQKEPPIRERITVQVNLIIIKTFRTSERSKRESGELGCV